MNDTLTAKQGKLHHCSIFRIDRDIDDTLPNPEERKKRRVPLFFDEEIKCDEQGDEYLECTACKNGKELRKKDEDGVPSFMEDEIDIVEEMPCAWRGGTEKEIRSNKKNSE